MTRHAVAPLVAALALVFSMSVGAAEPAAPLLVVEQQRASMVARLAQQWGPAFAALPGSRQRSHEDLANVLWTLRADRLFAVSLAAELDAVESVLAESASDALPARDVQVKALGDANADLTYTPLNPCRILDTRAAGGGGPLAANVARTFNGFAANFSTQGGTASNCAIPNGVAALAMNVYAVNPTNLGFIKVWPANATEPAVSTVNYQVGITAIATGALVPVDAANSNRFSAKSPAQVDFIADVVGYFRAPGGTLGDITAVTAGTGLSRGGTSGAVSVGIATAGVTAAMMASNGCTSGQILKYNGTNWACAADATGGGGGVTSITAGTGLSGGTITTTGTLAADTAYLQRRVSGTCPAGSSIRTIAADGTVTCEVDDVGSGPANAFVQGGNAFGATAVLGTSDNNAVDIRVNNVRVMRYEPNPISPNKIGGSPANTITAGVRGAVIAGGGALGSTDPDIDDVGPNRVTDAYGTIGGGASNQAGVGSATTVDQPFATVGGGIWNIARGANSTVGGGGSNTASGHASTIGGGGGNDAGGTNSTIGGGSGNSANGLANTVGGGEQNSASGFYGTVAGGRLNITGGMYSTVAGGLANTATGAYSFAAGRRAKALADGVFAFADSSDVDFDANTPNSFVGRFTGGYGFWTNTAFTVGCHLPGGGSWNCVSSREQKQDFVPVDAQAVLQRVAALPISEWRYRTEVSAARHMGPTAQDFRAAFGLGDSDKSIATVDADGVALAAIQGLNAKLEQSLRERDAEVAAQREEIAEQRQEIATLRVQFARQRAEIAELRATRMDVATLRAAIAELLRERSSSVLRTRLEP